MQQCKRVFLVLLTAVSLAAAVTVTGCSGESDSELVQATEKARRLFDKACSHLKDPVYKVGQEYAPLPTVVKISDPCALQLVPPETLNPRAWNALSQAERELAAALGAAGEAPPAERASAQAMLGRVHAMRGYHLSIQAAQARQGVESVLAELEQAAVDMADHGKRVASCDKLLAGSDDALAQMATRAAADATAATTKIGEINKKIVGLEKDKAALQAVNDKLLAEARKLRVQSQLAPAMKGVELFDQALAKESQATKNAVKISEFEDAAEAMKKQLTGLKQDLAAAQQRKAAADKIAADRKARKQQLQKKREEFVKLVADSQQKVEGLAGKVVELCQASGGVSAIEKRAIEAYENANKQYEAAIGQRQPVKPALAALHGDVLMARGHLRARSLNLQRRLADVEGQVKKLWSSLPIPSEAPPVIAKLPGYLPEAEKAKEDAKRDFRWAAKHYEKALRPVPGRLKWAYRLQIASAYGELYRLSQDDQDRKDGRKFLKELDNEKVSPYVSAHLSYLKKLLPEQPSGPTTAPSAP